MRRVSSILLFICLAEGACQRANKYSERRFELNGRVVSVDRQHRQVTVSHGEIPGYMAAMTMPFTVRDDWALSVLAPNQTITAVLVVGAERSWLEQISITELRAGAVSTGKAPDSPEPAPGAEVPDFSFVNQDGKPVHLHQYRGRALVITFIYTRCPLPDFCPRMNRNFSEIHEAIINDATLRSSSHLLTLSFDPDFDSPQVLRQYGAGYAGRSSREPFRFWEFATGSAAEVKKAATFFGLSYRQESGQIVHSLRTALVAPDGRLVRLYHGNDWTPGEIIEQLRSLARQE